VTAPRLGVVADDLTGACDLADAVCGEGLPAVVLPGVPEHGAAEGIAADGADCAVVALKSRTAPVAAAVADSVAAARALLAAGYGLLYQKYCSTFDSTDAGNIGPVADALRALLGGSAPSIGTPATPRVERTVYQGHLFVGRQLLSESPLRDHPLTPMRDPDLLAVLGRQTPHPVAGIGRSAVAGGPGAVSAAIVAALRQGAQHLLLDALDDADLDTAAAALLPRTPGFLAGGAAGLAAAFARALSPEPGQRAAATAPPAPGSPRLIVAGSCSARTREQVAAFTGPRVELSPPELAADFAGTVGRVLRAVADHFAGGTGPVLVTSSAGPQQVAATAAKLGGAHAAELVEGAHAQVAARAVAELGVRRLLVAGGETSGAVLAAVGGGALRVGPAVGPGLAWMVPDGRDRPCVLPKSGNFGAADLFTSAWAACP
jgi:uncharacterized protein YgbK (DUF1537 family)